MGRRGIIDASIGKETSDQEGRQVLPMEPVLRGYPFNAIFEDLELIPPIIKAFIPDRDSINDTLLETRLLFIGNPRCPLIDVLQGRINQLADRCNLGSQFQRGFVPNRKSGPVPDKPGQNALLLLFRIGTDTQFVLYLLSKADFSCLHIGTVLSKTIG